MAPAGGTQIRRRMYVRRREFLAGAMGLTAATVLQGALAGHPDSRHAPLYLAARRHGERHEAVLLDGRGRDLAALLLPARGHSFAIDAPRARAVVFARQPGYFAQAFSLPDCAPLGTLDLPETRHFFGHGAFAADGALLFATENDFDAGRGVIGVYDAREAHRWQRVGEFDSAGVGPHEVLLLPDGATLCVANGGLLTHPDFGKTPLNLATMRPSLAYLDAASGRLLESVALPAALFQLSIRHLAVDASGAVWFACQHQGPATEQPLLLGRHRRGAVPELVTMPLPALRDLRNYLGSITIDREGGVVCASSPVGGSIAFWDTADGQWLGSVPHPDGCAVAALEDGRFLVSDGFGAIIAIDPRGGEAGMLPASPEIAWDNHMRRA
jgi:hypothetical protein